MALVEVNWKPEKSDLRRFAISIIIGFSVIGWGVWLLQGNLQLSSETGSMVWAGLPYLWGIPMAIGLLSLTHPLVARPFYLVWMGFSFVMGTIFSHLILALFFYLMITPTGLILRLFGHDPLRLRKKVSGSNWQDHGTQSTKASCERLF